MSNNTIIRQYGSGGKAIGEQLSKELGIPFYDKELIALAAEKSGMSADLLKEVDERASNSLLYSLSTGMVNLHTGSGTFFYNLPMNDRLFIVQADLIKQFAKEGPCVIVGRCADYIRCGEADPPVCRTEGGPGAVVLPVFSRKEKWYFLPL